MTQFTEKSDPRFKELVADYDFEELSVTSNTIFGLWPDFSYAYFNPGWFDFAAKNGGQPEIFENWGLGTNFLAAISQDLQPFYRDLYQKCLADNQVREHEYQCSSALLYRIFLQTIYPISGQALLIVNALKIEKPHSLEAIKLEEVGEEKYLDEYGIVHQCCHCRKVQSMVDKKRWDWVPTWVEKPPLDTSHGLCPVCYNYYYR